MVDLRSDTVTKPTDEMRDAMHLAVVGDDVYGDDPTINKLEDISAKMLGKQAALFVPSGTMGNLLALMTHTTPGQELIVGKDAHIHIFEVSGYARLCGLGTKIIPETHGKLDPKDIEENIMKKSNIHHSTTGLICIENTHNVAGGIVKDLSHMKKIREVADRNCVPIHLDGARIFNAAQYLDVPVSDIAAYANSVMMCLSKGLGAPVGSILAGTKPFIDRARHNRKMLGGGMRQAGILAAAGIIALKKMPNVLKRDHDNARYLAEGLASIDGIKIDLEKVHTNIVMADIALNGKNANEVAEALKVFDILTSPFSDRKLRFTTNHHISQSDIDYILEKIKAI